MMFWNGMKERAMQFVAQKYLNQKYGAYGELTRLAIDSQRKTIQAQLELKGEAQPILVNVNAYELIEAPGKTLFRITEASCSREWLTTAFQEFVRGREFEIPEVLGKLL